MTMETQAPIMPPPVGIAARAARATKTYGVGDATVVALDDVSLDIPVGRFTSIMGPSGSGKSTLLHCLAGLDNLSYGMVFIGQTSLATLRDKALTELRRTQLGFIFQSYNLIPTLTARENMVLPIELGGGSVDPQWFDQVVAAVGLESRLDHRPSELSGGQQQRVAVGRALMNRPQIIFADEPTGNLDSNSGTEILTFMRRAVDELRQTIVMVTHDPYAAAYGDQTVFLGDGKIVARLSNPTADDIINQMRQIGHS